MENVSIGGEYMRGIHNMNVDHHLDIVFIRLRRHRLSGVWDAVCVHLEVQAKPTVSD